MQGQTFRTASSLRQWRAAALALPLLALGCPAGEGTDAGAPVSADAGEREAPADGGTQEPEPGAVDGGDALDSGPPADAGPTTGPCPADPPAGTFVVYGDEVASGWEAYGFAGAFDDDTAQVCTGAVARSYTSQQYDGFAFETVSDDVAAGELVARIYLDTPGNWAVAAVRPGEDDPHQFIGDEVWDLGWQTVRFAIPESTPTTRWILFEKQDEGVATIWIDDLWLLPR